MGSVVVTVLGRQFRLACDDGEEAHLRRLADDFSQRLERLHERFGEIGDARLTLMASLELADELGESARKLRRLEEEIDGIKDARLVSADRDKARDGAVAAALNAAAERIEAAARRLNQSGGASAVPLG